MVDHVGQRSEDAGEPSFSDPEADDPLLLPRLQAGDDRAFEILVRRHSPRMLAVARRLLGSDDAARDAVQDAFLSAFRSIRNFTGASSLGTWLHRIVVNAALMRLRSRRRRPEMALEELDALMPRYQPDGHRLGVRPAWSESADALLAREEVRATLAARLAELPEAAREIILLRDVEGLDTAATAEALGITESAAKVRLHRARLALRALMELDLDRLAVESLGSAAS